MNRYECAIEIANKDGLSLVLIIEPWGNEFELKKGQAARIVFSSSVLQTIPITHLENTVVIEGVEGLQLAGIWIDGELAG
jgi:hypothetical protein